MSVKFVNRADGQELIDKCSSEVPEDGVYQKKTANSLSPKGKIVQVKQTSHTFINHFSVLW